MNRLINITITLRVPEEEVWMPEEYTITLVQQHVNCYKYLTAVNPLLQ